MKDRSYLQSVTFHKLQMGTDTKEKPRNKFRIPIELAVNDDVAKNR